MQIDLSLNIQLRIFFANKHFDKSFRLCLFRGSLPLLQLFFLFLHLFEEEKNDEKRMK